MRCAFVLALASSIAAGPWARPAPGQDVASPTLLARRASAVDEAVRAVMADQGLVGVAIGVIERGRIVHAKGYGLADREANVPATAETVFNWASNSKPMAAILAMQLVAKGQLDLDADVRRYVPEFPDKGAKITCRQLLCHQGGIPHYANGKVVPARRGSEAPRDRPGPISSLDRFAESPLIFAPGTKADYSSYAFILLSAAIERAGEQSFDAQVRDRVAGPLRMASLQLDGASTRPGWAAGYAKEGDRIVRGPEEAHDWKFGAGGYKSDVRDFARWAEALIDHRLVSTEAERTMWTPRRLAGGEATRYGLGFVVEGVPGALKVSHNGSQGEATTRMVLYPDARRGVVVMTNCSFARVAEISTAVFSALGREP